MATTTRTKTRTPKRSSVQNEEPAAKVAKIDPKDVEENKKKAVSISEIFENLEYGPAPESPAVAEAWLDDHNRHFGHFINNQWVRPEGRKTYNSYNPATGQLLCTTTQGEDEDVELAVGAAKAAFESWSKLPGQFECNM